MVYSINYFCKKTKCSGAWQEDSFWRAHLGLQTCSSARQNACRGSAVAEARGPS